jgi:hypothetical protein
MNGCRRERDGGFGGVNAIHPQGKRDRVAGGLSWAEQKGLLSVGGPRFHHPVTAETLMVVEGWRAMFYRGNRRDRQGRLRRERGVLKT